MYETISFTIPNLIGISEKNIEEHLKLYAGYVKNVNHILATIKTGKESNEYAASEMQRRLGFEYNGMKNHEYFFGSLEGGHAATDETSLLHKKIVSEWGSFNVWLAQFKKIAKKRGVGWAILYYDRDADRLLNTWVDEQHLGHLNSAQYIVGIDMWEHSFVADYHPSGKSQYIDDYFANLNWQHPEGLFAANQGD